MFVFVSVLAMLCSIVVYGIIVIHYIVIISIVKMANSTVFDIMMPIFNIIIELSKANFVISTLILLVNLQ